MIVVSTTRGVEVLLLLLLLAVAFLVADAVEFDRDVFVLLLLFFC